MSTGGHLEQRRREKTHVTHCHCKGTAWACGMGWDVGLDQWGPRPGRAVGAGAQPCCSITGAGADGPGGLTRALGRVGRGLGGDVTAP